MKMRIAIALLLGSTLATSGCATYTSVRQHQDLQQEAQTISSIAILPPDVSIELIAFTGENEKETQKQEAIGRQLTNDAKSYLTKQGITVVDFDFTKAIAERQDLAFAITQCKEALDKSEKTLYKAPVETKNKGKFNESIGPAANVLAETTGADAFLVVKYNGFEKTAGMIAKDIVASALMTVLTGQTPVAQQEGASVELALIAADSGAILWVNKKAVPQLNTSAEQQAFKEFPQVTWKTAAGQTTAVTKIAGNGTENAN